MTSTVGGGRGVPKSRRREQNELICDSDEGKGGGSKNPKMLWTSCIWKLPKGKLVRVDVSGPAAKCKRVVMGQLTQVLNLIQKKGQRKMNLTSERG